MKKTMFRHRQIRCQSQANPKSAFWWMLILAMIVSFPVAAFCQDPANNGPSNIAYWNGGNGTWFGSGGSTNWVCEVSGSEYNCAPPNDASWTVKIGAAGPGLDGTVSVLMSTPATAGTLLMGDGTNGNLTVTGNSGGGPTLTAGTLVVGVTHSGSTVNPDTMTISNGGMVNDINGYIGDHGITGKVSNGVVNVTGGAQWNNSGVLEVGLNGNGTLNIAGGTVSSVVGIVGVNGPSTGIVTLTGGASILTSSQFLDVGLFGTGRLDVGSGSTVIAPQIQIGSTGLVNLIGSGGTLVGNVTNNGTLDPITTGNILGNYTQGAGGNTVFDINGANSYGQLDVTGNVDMAGTLTIDFTGGFKPRGETFDLINVAGSFSDSNMTVDLIGCKNCQLTFTFINGQFITTWTGPPAEPETLVLLAISLVAMAVFVGCMRRSILPDLRI
jgi:T5SS/PEP-CTERM-associated repeat protein